MPRYFLHHIEWRHMISNAILRYWQPKKPQRKHCALSSVMYLLMPAKLRCAICKPVDAGPSLYPTHKQTDALGCVYAFCYILYRPLWLFDCPYFLHFAVADGSVARQCELQTPDRLSGGWNGDMFRKQRTGQREQETYTSLWNPEQAPSHNNNWNQYANLVVWFCSSHVHWSLS